MEKSPYGATLGDFGIALVDFAEHHPWRFILRIPPTIGLSLVVAVIALKIVLLGPLTQHKSTYDRIRARTRGEQESTLL